MAGTCGVLYMSFKYTLVGNNLGPSIYGWCHLNLNHGQPLETLTVGHA